MNSSSRASRRRSLCTNGSWMIPTSRKAASDLIVHGQNRDEAIARMKRALDEFVIEGIKTTIPLHKRIMDDPDFQKGRVRSDRPRAKPRRGHRADETRAG